MSISSKANLLGKNPKLFFYFASRSRIPNSIEDRILDLVRPEKPDIVNEIDLRFLGMRRSGNHAIIDWFIRSMQGSKRDLKHLFLNNLDVNKNGYRNRYHFPDPQEPPDLTGKLSGRRWRRFDPLDLLVRSYEDYSIECFHPPEAQKYYGASRIQRNYVLLRDPLNLLASRRKSKFTATRQGVTEIDLYLNNAKLLDRPESGLSVILYNRWLIDPDYRNDLARDIGMAPADLLMQPTKKGGGSSFSGTQRDVNEQELLSRWRMAADQGLLDDAMNHEGIQTILRTHFPEIR